MELELHRVRRVRDPSIVVYLFHFYEDVPQVNPHYRRCYDDVANFDWQHIHDYSMKRRMRKTRMRKKLQGSCRPFDQVNLWKKMRRMVHGLWTRRMLQRRPFAFFRPYVPQKGVVRVHVEDLVPHPQ